MADNTIGSSTNSVTNALLLMVFVVLRVHILLFGTTPKTFLGIILKLAREIKNFFFRSLKGIFIRVKKEFGFSLFPVDETSISSKA
ncbi:MAG: hypothetical protein LBD01_06435, partial [Puniceicoccales bacterium]|nr:hypothetical protein [Puniceicoccales bacterium]